MSAWFRWERGNGRWCPVVIYGDKPNTQKGEDRFTNAVPVPADCMSSDGSPMFGALRERFPAPVEKVAE